MRDLADNVVIICSIENVDPMVRAGACPLLTTCLASAAAGDSVASKPWWCTWRLAALLGWPPGPWALTTHRPFTKLRCWQPPPQGVHTGDSITVAPVQTLTDKVGRRAGSCVRPGGWAVPGCPCHAACGLHHLVSATRLFILRQLAPTLPPLTGVPAAAGRRGGHHSRDGRGVRRQQRAGGRSWGYGCC